MNFAAVLARFRTNTCSRTRRVKLSTVEFPVSPVPPYLLASIQYVPAIRFASSRVDAFPAKSDTVSSPSAIIRPASRRTPRGESSAGDRRAESPRESRSTERME